MPGLHTTRIYPRLSDDSGRVKLAPTGAATGWQALNNESDGSYVGSQFSNFEPFGFLAGPHPALDLLPVGVGKVHGMRVNVRAWDNIGSNSTSVQAGEQTSGGSNIGRVGQILSTSPTTYTSGTVTAYGTKAAIEALGWWVQVTFIAHNGVETRISSFSLDVDWDPSIGGMKAFLFSVLGPLAAVGLHEMPRLAAEVLRRGRTRMTPEGYLRAWRELREDRGRLYFPL